MGNSSYSSRYIDRHGKGRVTGRSVDIARAILLDPEVSYSHVAKRFGVTRQRVGQIVRRLGVSKGEMSDGQV